MRENMGYFFVKWNQYVEISARERLKKDENTKHRGTLAQLRTISRDQGVWGRSVALYYNNNDLCRSFVHVTLSIISINPRPCRNFFTLSLLPQDFSPVTLVLERSSPPLPDSHLLKSRHFPVIPSIK